MSCCGADGGGGDDGGDGWGGPLHWPGTACLWALPCGHSGVGAAPVGGAVWHLSEEHWTDDGCHS